MEQKIGRLILILCALATLALVVRTYYKASNTQEKKPTNTEYRQGIPNFYDTQARKIGC